MMRRKTITHILWHQRRRELITAALVDLLTLAAIGALVLACAGMARGDCVVCFTASWCTPCQQMRPLEDKLRSEGYDVRYVDIDQQPRFKAAYRILRVPTFVYVAETSTGNYEMERVSGILPEAHLRWFCRPRRVLVDVAPVANLVRSVLGMPILVTPY